MPRTHLARACWQRARGRLCYRDASQSRFSYRYRLNPLPWQKFPMLRVMRRQRSYFILIAVISLFTIPGFFLLVSNRAQQHGVLSSDLQLVNSQSAEQGKSTVVPTISKSSPTNVETIASPSKPANTGIFRDDVNYLTTYLSASATLHWGSTLTASNLAKHTSKWHSIITDDESETDRIAEASTEGTFSFVSIQGSDRGCDVLEPKEQSYDALLAEKEQGLTCFSNHAETLFHSPDSVLIVYGSETLQQPEGFLQKFELLSAKKFTMGCYVELYQLRLTFRVVVLTWKRFSALQRLLMSVETADYASSDSVMISLEINIDGGSGDDWDATVNVARNFHFSHGYKFVTVFSHNRGLAQAWFDAWTPRSYRDHAVILEDDLELSPHWYRWLSLMWESYSDLGHNMPTQVGGISLQRQQIRATDGEPVEVLNNHRPFLYKLLGSWGFSPNAMWWQPFLDWIKKIDQSSHDVSVPGLVTSRWFEKVPRRSMWTQFWIYYCNNHSLSTVFVNPPHDETLAASHRERGEHYQGNKVGRDHELVEQWPSEWDVPPRLLPRYDWNLKELRPPVILPSSCSDLLEMASTLLSSGFHTVVMRRVSSESMALTKSWICNVNDLSDVIPATLFVTSDVHVRDILSAFDRTLKIAVCPTSADTIMDILSAGLSVFTVGDSTWFQSPLLWLRTQENCDIIISSNQSIAGFDEDIMFLNTTRKAAQFWVQYNIARGEPSKDLEEESHALLEGTIRDLRWAIFPKDRFPASKWYIDADVRLTARPLLLQVNHQLNVSEKEKLLQTWSHWFLGTKESCTARSSLIAKTLINMIPEWKGNYGGLTLCYGVHAWFRSAVEYAQKLNIGTISHLCEIGYGSGTSAVLLMEGARSDLQSHTKLILFEKLWSEQQQRTLQWLREYINGTSVSDGKTKPSIGIELVPGDMRETIPSFGGKLQCDLIFVDAFHPDDFKLSRQHISKPNSIYLYHNGGEGPMKTRDYIQATHPHEFVELGCTAPAAPPSHPCVYCYGFFNQTATVLAHSDVTALTEDTHDDGWHILDGDINNATVVYTVGPVDSWDSAVAEHERATVFSFSSHVELSDLAEHPFGTLHSWMIRNGHHHVDVLKLDVEHALVFRILKNWLHHSFLPFTYLLLQITEQLDASEADVLAQLVSCHYLPIATGSHRRSFKRNHREWPPTQFQNICPYGPPKVTRGDTYMKWSIKTVVTKGHWQDIDWPAADLQCDTPPTGIHRLSALLTKHDVSDRKASFVADPFLIQHRGTWYMFMEVLNDVCQKGEIGVARYDDANAKWLYDRIVLDLPTHLSFPFIFYHNHSYYLLPENHVSLSISMYSTSEEEFPYGWRTKHELIADIDAVDTILHEEDGKWFLFTSTLPYPLTGQVYLSDFLLGPYHKHSSFSVPPNWRNGGRVAYGKDGMTPYIFHQDASTLSITLLARCSVSEVTVAGSKQLLLRPFPSSHWRANGMHQFDAHPYNGSQQWIIAIDGWYSYM